MSKSELGQTIADLRRTIAWMDLALARLEEGIVVVEAKDMRIRYANDAFANMVGRQRIFVLGAPLAALFPKIEAREGEGERQSEHRLAGPRGQRVIEVRSAALPFSKDELIFVFRDVTARKAADSELAHRRTELERSNEDLQHFATFASHDLQEPLRKMSLYSQLLRQKYAEKLDKKADAIIDTIVSGAGRMQEMLKGLQRFCALERESQMFALADCEVILKEALSDLELAIRDSRAEIAVSPLPIVRADAAQLAQVFQNLLANALKFRSQDPPKIEIGAERRGGEWLFWVRDNGIGIEKEYHARIFRLFERLHGLKDYSGSGIGLALCRRIVERHGGRIWVESHPGSGSAFFFTLPDRE